MDHKLHYTVRLSPSLVPNLCHINLSVNTLFYILFEIPLTLCFHLHLGLQMICFIQVFPPETCTRFFSSFIHSTCPNLLTSTILSLYLARSTNYEACDMQLSVSSILVAPNTMLSVTYLHLSVMSARGSSRSRRMAPFSETSGT